MYLKRRNFLRTAGALGAALMTEGHGNALAAASGKSAPGTVFRPGAPNSKIREDYDLALNILKPGKKDLEHGLELHRQSVVFDAYGFMPRAAYDGAAVAALVEGHASEREIRDLQEEQSMTRFVNDQKEREEFLNAWQASGVTCVFQNAGEEGNQLKVLLKRLARFTYVTDSIPGVVGKAVHPDQVVQAKKEDRHMLFFTGNGVPMPLDLVSVEEELGYIRIFYQLGIRMMHLTYNRRNLIGDGCGEPANAGLSDFGRDVVKEMNRLGVIVDVAHAGWQTSLEAARRSERPMVASHTTAASVYKHIRSKPDEVIRAIADTGGYAGICCIPRFLGGTGDIARMMKHIDHVVKKFGADHVAIGTDVSYTSILASEENKLIPPYRHARTRWEALWPADDFKETAAMRRSMAWTNWPLFTVGMVQMGYSDEDIRKILGGNVLRVLKDNM